MSDSSVFMVRSDVVYAVVEETNGQLRGEESFTMILCFSLSSVPINCWTRVKCACLLHEVICYGRATCALCVCLCVCV